MGVLFTDRSNSAVRDAAPGPFWNRHSAHSRQNRLRRLLQTRVQVDGATGVAGLSCESR